jgi:ABC-type dipeptide/oligopeptide/nickel transport system permease component
VTSELWPSIKNTIPMVALGTFFSIVLGIIVGVISAWRRGTFADRAGLYTGLGFYSMPPQWLGLLMVLFVAGALGLPTSGIKDPTLGILVDASTWDVLVDRLRHMVLPALTLGMVLYGEYALIVRSSMLETLGEDYVLTARAKGLSNWAIVWRHGLRNALLPIITLVALSLGYIIAGTITIEYVFSYPGVGLAVVEAIDQRDYPILQGAFLLLTLSVIVFNLVADLLYFRLDPRVQT